METEDKKMQFEPRDGERDREFGFFIPEEILPLIYADVDRLAFLYRKRTRRRNFLVLLFMFAIIAGVNLAVHFSVFSLAALLVSGASIWYISIRNVFGEGQIRRYRYRLQTGQFVKTLVGSWLVRIHPDGYEIFHGDRINRVSGREQRVVLQTDGAYFIFDADIEKCDIFLKSMFRNAGEKEEWERQYRMWGWQEKKLDQKRVQRLSVSRLAAALVLTAAILAYIMEPVAVLLYRLYTAPLSVTESALPEKEEEFRMPADKTGIPLYAGQKSDHK